MGTLRKVKGRIHWWIRVFGYYSIYVWGKFSYIAPKNAPEVSLETLPNRVVDTIKSLCSGELQRKQTGFGRDGKGMKYADYYSQFFDDAELMRAALNATLRILGDNKASVAGSRGENLINTNSPKSDYRSLIPLNPP